MSSRRLSARPSRGYVDGTGPVPSSRSDGMTAAGLTLVPKHWYSWNFRVVADAREIGEVTRSWWRERGSLRIEGVTYSVRREGLWSGDFLLEREGRVVARAEKTSPLRRRYRITAADRRLTLEAASAFGRSFLILHGSRSVGSVRPARAFSRKAIVEMEDPVSPPVQLFLAFLVVGQWKRTADAAAAAG